MILNFIAMWCASHSIKLCSDLENMAKNHSGQQPRLQCTLSMPHYTLIYSFFQLFVGDNGTEETLVNMSTNCKRNGISGITEICSQRSGS